MSSLDTTKTTKYLIAEWLTTLILSTTHIQPALHQFINADFYGGSYFSF